MYILTKEIIDNIFDGCGIDPLKYVNLTKVVLDLANEYRNNFIGHTVTIIDLASIPDNIDGMEFIQAIHEGSKLNNQSIPSFMFINCPIAGIGSHRIDRATSVLGLYLKFPYSMWKADGDLLGVNGLYNISESSQTMLTKILHTLASKGDITSEIDSSEIAKTCNMREDSTSLSGIGTTLKAISQKYPNVLTCIRREEDKGTRNGVRAAYYYKLTHVSMVPDADASVSKSDSCKE